MLAVRTVLISKNALKTNKWGDLPREVMEKFQAYLVETEVVPKTVDVSTYYTNDLIGADQSFRRSGNRETGARVQAVMNELSSLGARTGARSVEATAAPRGVFLQRLLARVRARPEWVCMPLTLVLLIGGWEWLVTVHKVSSLILPPPSDIVTALYSGFANGVYVNAL